MEKYLEIRSWWNTCGLDFQEKLTILMLEVSRGNKDAKDFYNVITEK